MVLGGICGWGGGSFLGGICSLGVCAWVLGFVSSSIFSKKFLIDWYFSFWVFLSNLDGFLSGFNWVCFNIVIWEFSLVGGWLNLVGSIICILDGFISCAGLIGDGFLAIWFGWLQCFWFWVGLV